MADFAFRSAAPSGEPGNTSPFIPGRSGTREVVIAKQWRDRKDTKYNPRLTAKDRDVSTKALAGKVHKPLWIMKPHPKVNKSDPLDKE